MGWILSQMKIFNACWYVDRTGMKIPSWNLQIHSLAICWRILKKWHFGLVRCTSISHHHSTVPARTSNGVHLRNAFEKLFTERLKKQSEIKDAEREVSRSSFVDSLVSFCSLLFLPSSLSLTNPQSILKSIREFASTFPNAQVSQKSEFLFIARDVREVLVKVDVTFDALLHAHLSV